MNPVSTIAAKLSAFDIALVRVFNTGLSICLFFGLLVGPVAANVISPQAPVTTVGIVSFQDESGMNARPEVGQRIARELQHNMNTTYKGLVVRVLSAQSGLAVEELAALGKQSGVKFVIRGGLLALNSKEVQLYADIVSVETASTTSVRAESVGTRSGADRIDPTNGEAFSSAIGQLAGSIYKVVASPLAEAVSPQAQESTDANQTNAAQLQTESAAEADEELQQVIAQGEALLSGGSAISAETLNSISNAIKRLKAALQKKATIIEETSNTSEADQEIAATKDQLQTAVSAATAQVSSENAVAEQNQPSGERKNLLFSISEYLGEAVNILQKIQEMRAAWRSASEDQSFQATSSVSEELAPTEEPVEEVSGVVTESGQPVEGATVTEPESGASAVTDSNGSYVLKSIVAGKLAKLLVAKSGKQAAVGYIDVMRGRTAIADFDLKPNPAGASRPTLVPSTVLVQRTTFASAATGNLSGVVRDAQGRPLARALVNLKGFAAARTDTQGRYSFINVPSGGHQLIIYKSGLTPKAEQVQVAAKRTGQSTVQLLPGKGTTVGGNNRSLILRGAGTLLRGVVLDDDKHPLYRAKITLMLPSGAVSTLAGANGEYHLRDLTPGSYRVLASKFGYDTEAQSIAVSTGGTAIRSFQLKKSTSRLITRTPQTQERNASRNIGPIGASGVRVGPIESRGVVLSGRVTDAKVPGLRPAAKNGQIRGQVLDAKTGATLSGASIQISGFAGVIANA